MTDSAVHSLIESAACGVARHDGELPVQMVNPLLLSAQPDFALAHLVSYMLG